MVEKKDGEKKKQPNVPARKHKASSGAGKRQAKKRDAYLAKRTARTGGIPLDRVKRAARRGMADVAGQRLARESAIIARRAVAQLAQNKSDEAAALGLEVPA